MVEHLFKHRNFIYILSKVPFIKTAFNQSTFHQTYLLPNVPYIKSTLYQTHILLKVKFFKGTFYQQKKKNILSNVLQVHFNKSIFYQKNILSNLAFVESTLQ